MALDSNLASLLTETVTWQQKTGLDANGQDVWSAGITLKCYPAFGSQQIQRRDGVVYVSGMALYFDANDPHVKQFQLGDRFTTPGIAGGQTMEAQRIEPNYSPGPSIGSPQVAWLVEVSL